MDSKLLRAINTVYACLLALFLIVPSLVVIPLAFSTSQFLEFPPPGFSTRYFQEFFADMQWRTALQRSLNVALVSVLISLPIGVAASWWLVRGRSRFKNLVESTLMLPMMIPIVVFGLGAYLILLRFHLVGNLWMVAATHAVLEIPFVVLTVTAALQTFDFRLVRAARVCGAGSFTAFRSVVLPIIAPAVGAGALIGLMTSFDEAVIALFIAGDTLPTLPVQMFNSITYDVNPLVPVAATVLTVVTLVLLLAALLLVRWSRKRTDIQIRL
ncbi:ABC transporter permease [Sciscionella marina]|uniref:ABC transporter permease n=1 Tax=Sciscionella marina TaxID=508770 RepID=UPI000364523B|nr:ABC transporter permease [Sciscionella marina]